MFGVTTEVFGSILYRGGLENNTTHPIPFAANDFSIKFPLTRSYAYHWFACLLAVIFADNG